MFIIGNSLSWGLRISFDRIETMLFEGREGRRRVADDGVHLKNGRCDESRHLTLVEVAIAPDGVRSPSQSRGSGAKNEGLLPLR